MHALRTERKIRLFAEHIALIVRQRATCSRCPSATAAKRRWGRTARGPPSSARSAIHRRGEEIARIEDEMRAEGVLHLHKSNPRIPARRAAPGTTQTLRRTRREND